MWQMKHSSIKHKPPISEEHEVILILLINHTANNQIHLWQWWKCHLSIWVEKFRTRRSVEPVFRTDLSWRRGLRKRNVPRSGLLCLWGWMGRYTLITFSLNDQSFKNFLKFMKVLDVKYVFRCPDANKELVIMLWNVIVRTNGLVLIVKYVRFFFKLHGKVDHIIKRFLFC